MSQLITITPEGAIIGLDYKSKGLDLRKLGKASTQRISDILFNEEYQQWFIEFLAPAGAFAGKVTLSRMDEAGVLLHELPDCSTEKECGILFFQNYEDAVKAEITIIEGLRIKGLCL